MITFNEIYSKIRAAVLGVSQNAYVSATYTFTPPHFPCVFIREINRFTPDQYVTFSNAQNVEERTIEVQIFSDLTSGAKTESESILTAVESAMRSAYFVETFCAPVDNADPAVYRLTARFRRIIGDADTI